MTTIPVSTEVPRLAVEVQAALGERERRGRRPPRRAALDRTVHILVDDEREQASPRDGGQ